jgi:hypothetical protein
MTVLSAAPGYKHDHRFVLAVDVGQSNDYTALALVHAYRQGSGKDRRHDVVHLERFRQIAYPEQIRRVSERYRETERHATSTYPDVTTSLVVDATGVGKPILDAFREAGLRALGVTITGGDTSSNHGGMSHVPKRELVTTLQVALQADRLRIAEGLPLADTLLKELRGFRVKIKLNGHASFGNDVGSGWREADHDDLVLATALAVWTAEKRLRGMSGKQLRNAVGLW